MSHELLLESSDIKQLHYGLHLHVNDVKKDDRMNWESECLAKISNGEAQPKENVAGTMEYLNTFWRYTEIVNSIFATLPTRVKFASYVTNCLRI